MDIKDVLMLSDGNKYVIASKIEYEYKIYLYLVDIEDSQNTQIGYLENDEIIIVEDKNIIRKLLPFLMKDVRNNF